MRKALIVLLLLALAGFAAWSWFGGVEGVTRDRVRAALTDQGVPPALADCMAGRMTDQLTIGQLRSLETLQARESESAVPASTAEVLARVRRIEDPQAVEVTIRAATSCALGIAI